MQIHLSDTSGQPIYQQVVEQIQHLVASGRLQEGEQLPPVRRLAEQLLINPNTVARAYRELEQAGTVKSRRGAGVFVSGGISPLARREQMKRLRDRVDALLVEAQQFDIPVETVLKLIEERRGRFESEGDSR